MKKTAQELAEGEARTDPMGLFDTACFKLPPKDSKP
jgi:hypothetical protein